MIAMLTRVPGGQTVASLERTYRSHQAAGSGIGAGTMYHLMPWDSDKNLWKLSARRARPGLGDAAPYKPPDIPSDVTLKSVSTLDNQKGLVQWPDDNTVVAAHNGDAFTLTNASKDYTLTVEIEHEFGWGNNYKRNYSNYTLQPGQSGPRIFNSEQGGIQDENYYVRLKGVTWSPSKLAQFQTTAQALANQAAAQAQYQDQQAAINNNPNLTADQKKQQLAQLQTQYQTIFASAGSAISNAFGGSPDVPFGFGGLNVGLVALVGAGALILAYLALRK